MLPSELKGVFVGKPDQIIKYSVKVAFIQNYNKGFEHHFRIYSNVKSQINNGYQFSNPTISIKPH